MRTSNFVRALAATVAIYGCSSGTTQPSGPGQVVSGRAALTSFPGQVKEVQAMGRDLSVTRAPVGNDGSFSLEIPPGKGYRLMFAGANKHITLVFPRASGAIDSRFDVRRGGAPMQLGSVRYVGDPLSQLYAFRSVGATSSALSGSAESDGECENGRNASTGELCIDDDANGEADACEGADDGNDNGADGECDNGVDRVTGKPCTDEAEGTDADVETRDDSVTEAAVAEHNVPSATDCSPETDDGDGECKDGVDQATGMPCTDPNETDDGDGECKDGVDQATGMPCTDPNETDDGDGECKDGVDQATGMPCTDKPESAGGH